MLMSSVEPKTVYINAVETPCVVNYLSGPFGGLLLTDLDSIPEDSVVKVQKKTTQDILNNVRKIKSCVYSCDITWGIFEPVGSPLHHAIDLSYTHYCLGLADQSLVGKESRGDYAAAYAIGSLDRLNNARLPRSRKEVEDAITALSNPNYVTLNQRWQERCDRLQAERDNYHGQLDALRRATATSVDGDTFMQVKRDYIEAFGSDNYGMLREHMDAYTRRGDGSPDSDLATLLLFTTMKYRLANKTRP